MTQFPRRTLFAGGAAALAAFALPSSASASLLVDQPPILSKADWGGREPVEPIQVVNDLPEWIILHHVVTPNTDDFSEEQARAHARFVQQQAISSGLPDTGYNFVISRGGYVTEGMHSSLPLAKEGTSFPAGFHTSGQNSNSIGIGVEGSYHDGEQPPEPMWDSMVALSAWVAHQYEVPTENILGHMDFVATACPGVIHDMLPQLWEEVDELRNDLM